MPRKLRLQYPGAIYHVMSRGDRREDIVVDDAGRQRFVETLGEACGKTGWREADLELRRKGDEVKVGLARRLRRETALGWRWIANRLHMGHWRSAANAVRLKR